MGCETSSGYPWAKLNNEIILAGPPFLQVSVMNRLQERSRRLDLSEKAVMITGGGWKMYEGKRIFTSEFRQHVQHILGVLETRYLDVYGMVEGNGWMGQCPEGHYLHVPYTYYRPLVLDDEFTPQGYGQWGRFAYLDVAALSYPGFVITGDMVRLLELCPACDHPGPGLKPEIRRVLGEAGRGCAEEVRHMVAKDVGG